MQAGTLFFLDLFHGTNASAEISELTEFLLDRLQTFMPLAVRNLSLRFVSAVTPVLGVQHLEVRDLLTEPRNLFAKNCQVIHTVRITSRRNRVTADQCRFSQCGNTRTCRRPRQDDPDDASAAF